MPPGPLPRLPAPVLYPHVTAWGEDWQELVAGLIPRTAVHAPMAWIGGRGRVQAQPMRYGILHRETFGVLARETTILLSDGGSLLDICLPIITVPELTRRTGREEDEEFSLQGP